MRLMIALFTLLFVLVFGTSLYASIMVVLSPLVHILRSIAL
jgi:hypothetical protein